MTASKTLYTSHANTRTEAMPPDDLLIDFGHKNPNEYKRELNLETALAAWRGATVSLHTTSFPGRSRFAFTTRARN